MISPITLDALRVLDAIDRRRSFAAAAEELHRVPSALSYVVNKLEEDLELELFDRSRRRAELTPVGRLVLEQGRRILLATDELTALARQTAQGWETELRIGIDSILSSEAVLDLLQSFQQMRPRTEIHLREEVLGGSWDALLDRRCDLLIGVEGAAPTQGFAVHPLGEVVFDFAVASNHPLTRLPQPLDPAALLDYATVSVSDSSRHLPVRSSGLLDGRSRIRVPSIAEKIEMQCRGLGVGYLPRHRIHRQLAEGRLQILRLQTYREPAEIAVAWRRESVGKGLAWFIDQLKKRRFDSESGALVPID